jgi:hypothetical protein
MTNESVEKATLRLKHQAMAMMRQGTTLNELIAYSRGYNNAMYDARRQTAKESNERMAYEIKMLTAWHEELEAERKVEEMKGV